MKSFFLLLTLLSISPAHSEDRLDPILVTSDVDKSSQPQIVAPGSQTSRDGYSIRKKMPNSFKKALGGEPNVEFVGGPRTDAELPQIRGLGSSRILVLDEGVRQNFQSGHNGRVFSDYSIMENIEIVKGPWSSLYGSGAMGGIVSLRRSTAADFVRRTGKDQGGELTLDGGSNASELGQRATVFMKRGGIEPLLSYRHAKSREISLGNDTKLPFSERESHDIYSSLGLDLGKGMNFELKLNRFQEKGREPLNPESADTAATLIGDGKNVKQDAVGTLRLVRENYDAHAKPYFRKTEVSKTRVSDGRVDIQTVETLGLDTWSNLRREFSETMSGVFTLGGEYFRDKDIGRRNAAALTSFPDGQTQMWGLYAQPELKFQKLRLTPGVRYDRFKSESGRNAVSQGHQTSKKLYASYEFLPTHIVFIGWGQAFNAPRLNDLYISGLHFPGGGPIPNNFFIANPDLRPERAHTAEAGFKVKRPMGETMLGASATYFITEAKDFISRDVNINGGTTRFANLQKVRLRGMEISASAQLPRWRLSLGYGQVRSKDKTSGQPLADTSADNWNAGLERELGDFLVGSDFRFTERQNQVPTGTAQTPSYLVQDLYAQYPGERLTLGLRVNNIHDKAYRRHASTNLEQGRDVRATASWLF